jgi:predicted nucleic acid-binding protein
MAEAADQLVIDASIAVAWHLKDEEHSDLARQLLHELAAGELQFVAPEHIRYEVPNAITVAAQHRSRLSQAEAQLAVAEFIDLDIPTVTDDALLVAAQSLAFQYGCASYDGLYLALTERLNLRLITADRKFYVLVSTHPLVRWIACSPTT